MTAGSVTAAPRTVVAERVAVMDSVSFATDEDTGGIIVTGSHCGASAGEYARRVGVACLIGSDAGFGKNGAGITGLKDIDAAGIIGVAVGHDGARIGDGEDVWANGVISYVNETARRAGFTVGQRLQDELLGFLRRRSGGTAGGGMARTVVYEDTRRKVVVMDSMSLVRPEDAGHVLVAASNGGAASGVAARAVGCGCVVLNDAGFGKDGAGVAGLRALGADGIPGIGVAHTSAEISNGLDTWENGVVSYVNLAAQRAGFAVGDRVKEAVVAFVRRQREKEKA